MSNPGDNGEPREVLSSLPRSRRQRPSARREAARAGRAKPTTTPKTAAKPKATAAKTTKPKAKTAPKAKPAAQPRKRTTPVAQARPTSATKTSAIPPAGYATPREGTGGGSADPAAAITGLIRGIRSLLPF